MSLIGLFVHTTTSSAATVLPVVVVTIAGEPPSIFSTRVPPKMLATARLDRAGEAGEVLEDVESPLPRKAQRRSGVRARDRGCARRASDVEAGAARRLELLVEQLGLVVAAEEEEAVEPREVAVDLLRAYAPPR